MTNWRPPATGGPGHHNRLWPAAPMTAGRGAPDARYRDLPTDLMMAADRPPARVIPHDLPVPGGADDGRTCRPPAHATLGLAGAAHATVDARGRRGAGGRADAGRAPASPLHLPARDRPARDR